MAGRHRAIRYKSAPSTSPSRFGLSAAIPCRSADRCNACHHQKSQLASSKKHQAAGTVNEKTLPFPGSLDTAISPPFFSTNSLHNTSPNPVPTSSCVPLVLR
jgi:hypothetical protein